MRLVLAILFAGCTSSSPRPNTRVELQQVTDPAVIDAVSETLATLELQLADTPRAVDRVHLRFAAIETLRPLVKPSGARALAEIRGIVLAGAAFERDVALAEQAR